MQLALMESSDKGTKRRMLEDSYRNKPVNYLLVNYILNHIEHEWVMPNTEPCRNREILMTATYICVAYGYSLRGYKGLWVYCQRLIDEIHIVKYDRRDPHVILSAMRRFKREDRDRMHLLPLINITQSGIMIWVWLERFVALFKAEGRTNLPEF